MHVVLGTSLLRLTETDKSSIKSAVQTNRYHVLVAIMSTSKTFQKINFYSFFYSWVKSIFFKPGTKQLLQNSLILMKYHCVTFFVKRG